MQNNFMILVLILILAFMTVIFLTWLFIYRAKAKERLLLIERGLELKNIPRKRKYKFPWLKIGVVLVFGSFGVLFGGFLEGFNFFKSEESIPILEEGILHGRGMLSLIFMYLFGGIGMILAHYLGKK